MDSIIQFVCTHHRSYQTNLSKKNNSLLKWCAALHTLQNSPCKHLAFPILLRQVPCGEEFTPFISKPYHQICTLLWFSIGTKRTIEHKINMLWK